MSEVEIRTNNVPRLILDAYQLTQKERQEFDYLNWDAIENGEDGCSFFRYKGNLYDLGDAMRINPKELPADSFLKGWDGYYGEAYFSGVLVKYAEDSDYVIVGHYFS